MPVRIEVELLESFSELRAAATADDNAVPDGPSASLVHVGQPLREQGGPTSPRPRTTRGGPSGQEVTAAGDRVRAARDAELAEDAPRVPFHRVQRDEQLGADLALGEIAGQQAQHG